MPPVSIENPILDSPFAEPRRRFRFDKDGIASETAEGRRSTCFHSDRQIRDGRCLMVPQ